jgi:glycosyltransferase involved in cell wall biosynthesis
VKILLLSHYYAPEQGAPQQRWSALAGHFVRAGHDFRVIAPAPHYPGGALLPGAERQRAGTVHSGSHGETVHRVSFREYAGDVGSRFADQSVAAVAAVRAARTLLRTWRPDVVVATVPSLPMLWAGRRVARLFGAPLIAEMRDAWPDLLTVVDEWDGPEPLGVARRRFLPATRGAMALLGGATTAGQRRADAVVTTTNTFADALRRRGIRRVHVVRNGAHPLPGYAGHSPRQPDGTLRVLYAGTIGRAQGLSTAVRAAALATNRGVPLRLRLVGAGADLPHLAVLADRIAAPVDLCGPTPRSAMAAHYDWADSVLVSLRPWPALSLTVPSKL